MHLTAEVSEEMNMKCPPRNMTVQPPHRPREQHCHIQTDRQTDRRTDTQQYRANSVHLNRN